MLLSSFTGKNLEKVYSINLQVITSVLEKINYAVKQNFTRDFYRVESENLTLEDI